MENHPTAHTPPLPVAATVPNSTATVQSSEKFNNFTTEINSKSDNIDKKDVLRRRKIGEEIVTDENYKSNALQ